MTDAPLTKRQRQILDFLVEYTRREGVAPTLEEIATSFGVNKVTIFGHVAELERKGHIRRPRPRASRGLLLTEAGAAGRILRLPVLGHIAAGGPLEAVETPEELDLSDLTPADKDIYALRVRGDSMIEDSICDGDIVLVERRSNPSNGETVVAVLPDGAATLKRFYREENRVRLQPANQSFEPIFTDAVEIRGVVIGVLRRY